MLDYTAWTLRASTFLRGLAYLPGRLEISDGVQSPDWLGNAEEWLQSEQCSLPPQVKAFVRATPQCRIHYRWQPPVHLQSRLEQLIPGSQELNGGGDFCNSYGFRNYDNRDWFEGELPPLMDNAIADVLPRFPAIPEMPDLAEGLAAHMQSMFQGMMEKAGVADDDRARGYLVLLRHPDGASLALDLNDASMPVVHIDSARTHIHLFSSGFDEFLLDWEQLCYLTPTLGNLAPWLTEGKLNPNQSKTRLLRQILKGGP